MSGLGRSGVDTLDDPLSRRGKLASADSRTFRAAQRLDAGGGGVGRHHSKTARHNPNPVRCLIRMASGFNRNPD